MSKIKALLVNPHQNPIQVEFENTLENLQKYVGGDIQMVYPFYDEDEIVILCNDDGKNIPLPLNRPLFNDRGEVYDIVCGSFLVVRAKEDDDDFSSLPKDKIKKFTDVFRIY